MDEKVSALINSMGSVAETLAISYKSFINAGFEPQQALYLTAKMLECMLPTNRKEIE